MDYFGIPKGRNIKIQKFIFGSYLPVLKNIGALWRVLIKNSCDVSRFHEIFQERHLVKIHIILAVVITK